MKKVEPAFKAIFIFILAIWSIYFLSLALPLQNYGLVPRTLQGLVGIISAPFLHGSLQHLINNTISFLIFASVLAILEGDKMFEKLFWMILIGGGLTWLFGRSASHIGTSGLIFSIFGYLLISGWFSKKFKYILTSLILGFLYGGMLFGVLPGQPGISWEGHLFGVIAGIIVSWSYHKK